MASGKKAMLKFMRALQAAPADAQFQVGDTWTQLRGWRPYQRIGDHVLVLSPDQARGLIASYEKMGAEPQWAGVWESLKHIFAELRVAADECDRKNREKIVPDSAAAHMPAAGSA